MQHKRLKIIFLLLINTTAIFILSCNFKSETKDLSSKYFEFKIYNTFNDTCFAISINNSDTLVFNRNIEVIENTFSDTLNIGFNHFSPKQTGKCYVSQSDTIANVALYTDPNYIAYLQETNSPELRFKKLCIYHYKGFSKSSLKNDKEYLKIRFQNME